MSDIVSSEQIEILEVSIRSERFQDNKNLYISGTENAASVGVELEIYENIYMPYLTGNILIQDDTDIYRVAEIKGTERVHVRFKSPETDIQIEKVFIISNVEKIIKVNDKMSQLLLELVEDHGYFNELQTINKSYRGTGVEIIEKILADNTNKSIRAGYYKEPIQKEMKYIVPWQTPYTAISTVLNFITTENSMPYFFFSSLVSDQLILTDMESILERPSFNSEFKYPFTYSQGQLSTPVSLEYETFNITNHVAENLHDTLAMAQIGAIGSDFSGIDTLSGDEVNIRIDMKQEFEKLADAEIYNLKQSRYPIDTLFRIDEKQEQFITDYNSKKYSVLANTPYDDVNGLVPDYLTSRQVVVKNNYLKHLANNSYSITVPGLVFAVRNIDRSVGHQINVSGLREGDEPKSAMIEDERKSGDFIMLAKKHVFNLIDETHNCVISIGRLTEPRRID